MLKKLLMTTLFSFLFSSLVGCASYEPLKAPCGPYGYGCCSKTKINQW